MDLKKFPCDLCGSTEFKVLQTKKGVVTKLDFPLSRCSCGMMFFNPRLDEKNIAELYSGDYYKGKGFDSGVNYYAEMSETTDEAKKSHPEDNWRVINELMPPPAKVLDYGCGVGGLMKILHNAGYDTEGYEISEFGRMFAQKNGFTVYDSLETIPENTYDIVTAIEVLEHCHSPLKALQAIQKALKPGGWFYYTTLNFDNWKELSNDRRDGYMAPEGHIQFFSTPVIKKYFKKVGLIPQNFTRRSYIKSGRLYKFLSRINLANKGHDVPQTWLEKIAFKAGNFVGYQFNFKLRTLPLARKPGQFLADS